MNNGSSTRPRLEHVFISRTMHSVDNVFMPRPSTKNHRDSAMSQFVQALSLLRMYQTNERPYTSSGYRPVLKSTGAKPPSPPTSATGLQGDRTSKPYAFMGTTDWSWMSATFPKPTSSANYTSSNTSGVLMNNYGLSGGPGDAHVLSAITSIASVFGANYLAYIIEPQPVEVKAVDNSSFVGYVWSETTIGTVDAMGVPFDAGQSVELQRASSWKGLACEIDFSDNRRENDPVSPFFGLQRYCSAIDTYLKQGYNKGESPYDAVYPHLLAMVNFLRPGLNASAPNMTRDDFATRGTSVGVVFH